MVIRDQRLSLAHKPSGHFDSVTRRLSIRRFLMDLPIPRKLTLIIALFCIVIFGLLALSYFGMEILSGSRAYVGGEGLWSKAQKGAVYQLTRYALFHDESDYAKYLEHIAISRGDRQARLELAKPRMNSAVVKEGFVQGRNHPNDVRIMTFMARHFYNFPYMGEAIELWGQADANIEKLQVVAEKLHREIASGHPSDERIKTLLAEINTIDTQLTPIEDAFSYTLGEGARWLKGVLLLAMVLATCVFLAMTLGLAFFISRNLCREIDQLRAGAARIAGGDYSLMLDIESKDEVGDLARSFQQMAAQRQQAERLKDEFFANVSHELRTPLTLILSPLESLLSADYGPVDPRLQPALNTMHNNTVRLLQLVNGLLDFSKLEAGQIQANREPIHIAHITEAVYRDFQPLIQERSLQSSLQIDSADGIAMMDRYLYERILFNLLSNAVKFTPSGGRIDIRMAWSGADLTLSVADTGIGIAAEALETIFQRFRQVEGSSTRRFEGTGLGLALVKEFAGLLEGTVTVQSAAGKGSTFTMTCSAPRLRDATGAAQTVAVANAPANTKGASSIVRPQRPGLSPGSSPAMSVAAGKPVPAAEESAAQVLIAEDNIEMASYIASLLQPMAITTIARDGNEALKKLQESPPDLILTDVMMPERDGIDLCRQVKSNPDTDMIPVVMLTALTHRDALLEGWKAGADEYLFKPFHPRELVTRVQSLLEARRHKKQSDEKISRLNESLRHHAAELETANRELEAFSYSVSHDLRGPLRIIDGFSEMLLGDHAVGIDSRGRHLLNQVRRSAQHMGMLIDDLLQLSRVGRADLQRRAISVSEIARGVVQELELREPQRKVAIEIQDDLIADADDRLLRVLLDNLLGNAWKFTGNNPVPRIMLGAEQQNGATVFFVCDNGAGFNMAYMDKLFQPFQRLHDKEQFQGTGIGLATAHRVVDRHGGRIWARSEENKGATFYFTLSS